MIRPKTISWRNTLTRPSTMFQYNTIFTLSTIPKPRSHILIPLPHPRRPISNNLITLLPRLNLLVLPLPHFSHRTFRFRLLHQQEPLYLSGRKDLLRQGRGELRC
jgi:hypothetical protein